MGHIWSLLYLVGVSARRVEEQRTVACTGRRAGALPVPLSAFRPCTAVTTLWEGGDYRNQEILWI
jgi:hypothetical protein